jgi:hypothetical protein
MANPSRPYTSSNLTILGVIHRDRNGAPLLARWLETWRPEIVTLEFSSFGLRFRQINGEALKGRVRQVAAEMRFSGRSVDEGALTAVLDYMDPSFEYSVASAYAAGHDHRLFLVDEDCFSRSKLSDVEELVSRKNLEKLLSGPIHDGCAAQKARARLFFERGVSTFSYTEEMGARDREMTGKIEALMARHKNARFLHICGWQHLCDPLGLYSSFNPMKVFIYDKALCV